MACVEVTCEACDTVFAKEEYVSVSAGLLASLFGSPQVRLARSIEHWESHATPQRIGLRACPGCGYLQSWMIPRWQRERRQVRIALLVVVVPYLLLLGLAALSDLFVNYGLAGKLAAATAGVLLVWGIFHGRRWLRRWSVPNRGFAAVRPRQPVLSTRSPNHGEQYWYTARWTMVRPGRPGTDRHAAAVKSAIWFGIGIWFVLVIAAASVANPILVASLDAGNPLPAMLIFGSPTVPAAVLGRYRYGRLMAPQAAVTHAAAAPVRLAASAQVMASAPADSPRRRKTIDGLIGSTILVPWTVYLVTDGFSWWSLLTGFLALGAVIMLLEGLGIISSTPPSKT